MLYNNLEGRTGANVLKKTVNIEYIMEFWKYVSASYVREYCTEHILPYSDGRVITSITPVPPSVDAVLSGIDKPTSLWKIQISS